MNDAIETEKISRLAAEYMVSVMGLLTHATGLDPTDSLILNTVSTGNVAHLLDDPQKVDVYWSRGLPIPAEAKRPIASLAIAESLGLPRETCRRRIKGLERMGLLERRPGGLIAMQERANPQRMAMMFLASAQQFKTLVRRLRQHGVEV